ncbi:class I SAM-dependent methyltransferase [Arcanobacterium hippocoleae]
MSIQDLTTADGTALLAALPPYSEKTVFQVTSEFRKHGYAPDLISAALTQKRLRAKAAAKFPPKIASEMFFTHDGIEQATRHYIALQHAKYLKKHGAQSVIDFGCGIGADSLAFAKTGLTVSAIEMLADTAVAAAHNLKHFHHAQVIAADGNHLNLHELGADAIWIDPARRKNGKRIMNPEQWAPSLSHAVSLARQFKMAGIKSAPGIPYENLPADAYVTWISTAGDLCEAVIWLGEAAPQPGRAAWLVCENNDGSPVVTELSQYHLDPQTPPVFLEPAELGPYLYEPNSAIIRAGLVHCVADEFGLAPISAKIAYVSGVAKVNSPLLTRFAVHEVLPLNVKKVRKRLAELEIGIVEIKKRGTDISPEAFRKALSLNSKHKNSAVLIAAPVMGAHRLILAERC